MQNLSQTLDEKLTILVERVAAPEALAYIYEDAVYLLYTIDISATHVVITMWNNVMRTSQNICRENRAELQEFVALVNLINETSAI